jgi:pimeloyl-ACP methyl ester carboxylesterase
MRALDLIYDGVNPRRVGELEAFRERTELRSEVFGRLVYNTWSLGEGDEAVVFLPGGIGHGEVWFPQMLALRNTCRTVTFSLPEVKTLETAADGVLAMLEAMGIRRIVVVGYSVGGLLAQVMLRRAPERIAGAMLCLTGAPSRDLPPEILNRWHARRKNYWRNHFISLNNSMRLNMAENAFKHNCPPGKEQALDFWRAFLEDSYCNHIYKKQFFNLNYLAQPNLYKAHPFAPGDIAGWKGEIAILYSEQDKMYWPEHEYLTALYPGARVVDLGEGGQFAMLLNEGTMTAEVEGMARRCAIGQGVQ